MSRRVAALLLVLAGCGGAHRHGPSNNRSASSLFVEVWTRGDHGRYLTDGATEGLAKVGFVRQVGRNSGGELELEAEVTRLDERGNTVACSVKVMVVRLPQHDLLGIADASGRASGDDAEGNCIVGVTRSLVQGRVRSLLQRRLADKR